MDGTNPVRVRSMMAYRWECSVCGAGGELEASAEDAREMGYEHEHATDKPIREFS